ncbi:MAG: serpin family protein [Enterocloster sp.]
MAGLGLTDAFDVSRADFTGITGESLSLSGVIQSTVFSVNENGVGPFSENGEAGFAGLYSGETALQMNLDRPCFICGHRIYGSAALYRGV